MPDTVVAGTGYTTRANRRHLASRSIRWVIPEKAAAITPAGSPRQEREKSSLCSSRAYARPLPVPEVPVVVLASRSRPGSVWHRAYARYVGSVPGARLVTARTRSHMVPLVDPASVAAAVAGVAGRQGRSTAQPR